MIDGYEETGETGLEVAVIGMAGRFPGAGDIREFWENLKNGVEAVTFFSSEELIEEGINPKRPEHPNYVKARGYLENIEYFDAVFFGYTPGEAAVMDPQLRFSHECVWEALEDAGCDPDAYEGLIGVYFGSTYNPGWKLRVDGTSRADGTRFAESLLSTAGLISTRLSYQLNLTGPSTTVNSACSTSLVAIHRACRGLLGGECDIALAGGVSIGVPQKRGYYYKEGMIDSPDGHCRAFDARANGTVFGSGIGVVILKRLDEAVEEGNHIYAVIKGSAVNNDGKRKIGYTAPSVEGQSDVIRAAYQVADVDPDSIGYIETHGTGTTLGDPIEIKALDRGMKRASTRPCPIGAVKTNIGHLDAAAGAAGFIKTVLCLMHRMIPPTLHFNTRNPELGLEKTPFYVNTELQEWKRIDNRPLRAGVSSFGIGGTNAHVVLEEAPVIGHLSSVIEETGKEREYQLILLSAKTASALDKMSQNLAGHLKTHPTIKLADAAYTLQVGRKGFVHRKALVCSTAAEAIAALSQPESPAAQTLVANIDFHHTVFMFAGQGSQYINMGLELYQQEPVFREEMDRCFEILRSLMAPMLGVPIKEVLYPGEMQNRSYRSDKSYIPGINQTEVTQPIIFAFEYALAKLLMHWGIIPDALIGYSFGEYMAACLAGVFSLEDALALIVLRGQLMQELSTGAMLSVPLPEEDLKPLLDEGVSIAIVNEPACIVAGEVEAIERFENKMKQHRLMCMRLNANFAVHTSIMADAVKTFETKLREVTLHEPQIPFISGISGDWINPAEAADYRYWIRHLRETIRFSRGIQRLLEEKRSIFIEIGPGRDLTVLVKRCIDEEAPQPVINLIRPSRKDVSDMSYLLRQMGRLWLYRQDIDWKAFHPGSAEKRYLVPLPTYPFERNPYWIDEDSFRTFINSVGELRAAQSKTTKPGAELDEWFYLPSWKRAGIREIDEIPSQPGRICLIFLRDDGDGAGGDTLGTGLIKRLKQKGVDTVTVTPGTDFTCRNSHHYQLDPREAGHYDLLLEELCKKNRVPQWIVYLWNVTGEKEPPELSEDKIENAQYSAFYGLVYLAQAIGSQLIDGILRILVVSNHMQEVMEGDVRCPEKALLLGPVKVIPHEYPNIRCRSVDIDMPDLREPRQKRLIGRLITEMVTDTGDAVIAYRGNQRWVQVFESVSLEKPKAGTPYLKDNGVYMITGGLGGIGLVLAEHLARQVKAKLILTSRSGKPDRQQWGRVRELEQRGAEVSVMAADAGNRQQMEGVIREAKERFGTINGVIHAAGVPDYGGVIQGRRDERKTKITEAVLAPKLKGTILLASLLSEQGINPDFIVLCSSVASIVAPVGEAAYIAANAFLDAYAHYYNAGGFSLPGEDDPGTGNQDSHHPMVYSINWGGWQEVGMAVEVVKRRGEDPETVLKEMILPVEGAEAFDRVLNSEFSQVVVFNLDLNQVLNRHLGQQEELLKKAEETVSPVQGIHRRPELDVPYAAPENEIQEKLVHIWQGFFGLDRVGIDDDFFDLGGDSLKATVVISRIHKKLQVKVSLAEIFDNPTVRKLSQGIGGADAEEFISIEAAEKREYYTSTPTQQRFYVIQQLTPGSTAFNNTSMIPLGKDVDKERLERALNQLIQRHEALRTSFEIVNGEPVQRIRPEVEFEIEFFDLAAKNAKGREEEENIMFSFVRPFDLSQSPLLRVGLVETPEGNYLLMVDMHHLISDGSTHQVLNRDFISLYAGEELSSLRLQYKDFSRWLNRALLSGEMKKHEDYWLKRLQGDLTLLELPTDFPRPGIRRFEGAHYSIMLGSRLTETVNRLVQRTGTTLYMVLLTALNILLSRYTGQQDILIGSPIAGRYHADLEDIIGLVIGGIVMRNYPTPLKTFRELLAEVKTNTLEAYEHQAYPLEELLKKIDWQERPGHDHIIDAALILQNIFNEPMIGSPPPDIQSRVSQQPVKGTHIPAFSKLDVTLYVMESRQAGDISFMFEYCTALFKPGTIERMAGHLVTLLRQVVENPDITAADMDMVSDEEKRQMLGSVPSFYPLSHAQKRIYYTDKTFPASGYHTEPFTVRYNETLERPLLEEAINILIRKNEGLRLRLVEPEFQNEPLQYIAPYTPYSLEEKTEQWIGEDILKPHPMVNNPLYYFAYIKFNEKESGFYMKFHHLVSDGWSVIFKLNEITSVYDALKAGETVDEAPNPSYLEYLCDERDYLRSSRAEKDRAFWHRYLLPLPEAFQLTKHAADTPIKNLTTEGKIMAFPGELRANMHRYRKNHKTSLFKLLLSALSIYVSRVTGSEDTVIATTNHNRTTERQRKMTGMFVSTFPLRVKADASMTFRDFVERNSSDVNYILKNHQRYPFDLLLEELRDAAGTDPLYLLNINLIGHPDIEEARYGFKRHFTRYDPSPLTIHINLSNRDISGVLELQWHYQTQVFSGQDIEQVHQGLINILDDALTHPDKQLSEIELLSRKEKEMILYRFNDTAAAEHYPQDKLVHRLFAEQVEKAPDRIAVVNNRHQLNFRELNRRANQLAHVLKEKGVQPDTIVGIMVEPSIEMVIGILGILKAGVAYLPIDPEYPQERMDYMLTDSGAAFLLTAGEILDVFKDKGTACCAPTITCNLHLSLAYIIYTSGTTGRPKGVMVTHGNLMAYLNAFESEFDLRASDVVIQQASFAFDAFVEELYPILLKGGRLAIPQRHEVKDVKLLKEYILEQNITMITCSPLLLNELNRRGAGGTMRIFISGGDRLKAEYVERLVKSNETVVYNTYGPTEGTVCASYYRCQPGDPASVPIGKPISNYELYITDRYGHLLPVGVPGELCITGPGVARGYLNQPELTAEKFFNYRSYRTYRTYSSYKTGDLACWLPDGNIEFLGRMDRQVKIRGYRIELGEIENRLNNHHSVKESVVVEKKDRSSDIYLCAYIVPVSGKGDKTFDPSVLREYLTGLVPGYMVPSRFAVIDKIPLTPGGKVDARGLPDPDAIGGGRYAAPRNELEEKLESIWQRVLAVKKDKIGIDADFFELGGHSLKATSVISIIHRELDLQVPLMELFNAPTIRGLARYLRGAFQSRFISIEPAEQKEYYPLSSAQKRLYILQQMQPQDTFYNMPYVIPLAEDARIEKLEAVFGKLIERHEILRTSFAVVNEGPVQRVHDEVEFKIEYYSAAPQDFVRSFDLSQAPLLRVGLIKSETSGYTLLLDMHHIATDGTSQEILTGEFTALVADPETELPLLRLQYRDFSRWESSTRQQEIVKQQRDYWLREFSGELPVLHLPTGFPRPQVQSSEGNVVYFVLNREETNILKAIVEEHDVTLYMVLLAVFNLLLSRLSGQEDIILGTPIAARRHADLQGIVGMLVNTLAMRNHPTASKTFLEFLTEIKQRTLEAYENQEYHFEELVNHLAIERDTSRNPVFDVMLNLLNQSEYPGEIPVFDKQTPQISEHSKRTSRFDMTWSAVDFETFIGFTLEYSTRLFTPATSERFIRYLKTIIFNLPSAENRERKLCDIPVLPEEEKQEILQLSRGIEIPAEEPRTLHRLFEERAGKAPDSTALVFEEQHVSYGELNRMANRLARFLREKGVGVPPGTVVGVMMERSLEMIIAILAILKAGGAYLPIDPVYPRERIDYMLKDSGARILVSELSKVSEVSKGTGVININIAGNEDIEPTQLCYVIYTSGTTGKPKGIMMEHGNLVNLIRHQHKYTNIDFSRVLQFTTISFDVSAQEIFSTLISGGQLTLVSKETFNDVPELFRLVEKNKLKTLFVPASFLKFVISEEEYTKLIPKDLAHIVTAGEQLIVNDTLRKYLRENRVYLHNHYGPAETHVVTAFTLDPREDVPTLPAVGKPILNTAIYIVDKGMNLAPVGVPGELLIGGIQVGRGYLNNPELTKERFLSVSYKSYMSYRTYSSKKIYKTGDLARWKKDGNIEFLGRIDLQVKIRGFRIEPGEIENRLMGIPGVKEAVVVDREDEVRGRYLCAYVVCGEREAVEVEELRDRLSRELPDYMVPAYFVRMEKIVLTPTGKVDRKRLPEPEVIVSENFAAPETEEEKKLTAIWSEILGIERDRISVLDNFFALGGHSLKATIMISKIHKVFNVRMPLLELFKTPVVRKLAQYITGTRKDLYTSIESAEQKEYYPLSSAQKRLYVLQQMEPGNTSYNMPFVVHLPGDADKEKLEKAFNKLITRHEMLRTSFQLVGEVPVQRVHKQVNFTLEEYDIENLEPGERDMAAFIENFKKPFDLSRVPLLRAARIKVEGETRVMVMDMHHIITDGTSQDILKEDFAVLYKGEDLPPLKLQCKDFSHWQNSRKQQEVVKRQGDYWMREFSDELPVLHLPADFPRPKVQSSEGNVVHFVLNREETNILKDIIEEHDITLYMVLSAVFNILFSKLSGQEDIVLGTPVAARRHADLQRVVGMLVNTLAMRNYPSAAKTFPEFLNEIKQRTLEAYENQEYHFEDLVGHLAIDRDASRNPVFDVMLNLLNQAEYSGEIPGIEKQTSYISEHKKGTSRFDMTWSAVDFETFIGFTLEYSTRLFTPATSERFIRYLKNIILHLRLPESRRQRLGDIPLLNQEEKQEILYFSRGIEKVVEGPGTLHQMFEEQAKRTPEGVSVVGSGQLAVGKEKRTREMVQVTYAELNEKAGRLARVLKEKGVQPDTIVGIMMERSVEMIIGMLGILKAGGAYLPIDPEYPRERIDYMLKDSGAKILLSELSELSGLSKEPTHLTHLTHPTHLCYLIYTSGTTGRPKGVSIQHRSVVNMVWYQRKVFNENPGSRISQASSAVFDGMTIEVWPCLLSGACLCIVDNETRMDPVRLKDWLIRHQVTISFQSTLIALMLLEEQWPETGTALEVLQAGGDRLNRYPAGSYPFRFYNIYGPTEDTAWATCTEVPTVSPSERTGPPPIGKPAGNKQVYILSRDLELQPLGVAGELCIGGAGLSRGYLNRPELTAEKFFNYRSYRTYRTYRTYISKKIYKTGDLACWLLDGNIEFLGRMDHQVKIRGFRIELGEIESILLKHLEINECVVLAKTGTTPGAAEISGDKYLCAYIVSTRELAIPELRDYLGTYLPHHMIPSFFVFLKEIPLTVNGKIDRKALPEPEMTGTVEYMPPRNEVEKKLVEVWSGVLGIEVGISDSFFHVGGDSIKAIQVSARLRKHDLHVKISDLFLYPEIKDLAKFVTKIQRDVDRVIAAGNGPDVGHRDITPEKLSWITGYIRDNIPGNPEIDVMYSLSPLQKTMLYHSLSGANQDVFFIQQLSRWQGTIENSLLETSLKILVERHDIFRTVFIYEELDEPLQIVLNRRTIEFAYEDISRGKEGEKLLCLEEYRKKDVKRGFDLSKDMLVRITLFRLDVNSYVLMWSNHYILMDGWCVGIVFKELVQIYESLRTGNPVPLEKVTPYRNYITWLEGQDKTVGFRYWENYLAGYCHYGDLIPTQPGKLEKEDEYNFKSYTFEIDKKEIDALKQLAANCRVTLNTVFQSLWGVLLQKYNNRDDVVFGAVVSGRPPEIEGIENMVGLFINSVPVRVKAGQDFKFRQLLKTMQENSTAAKSYEYLPFTEILAKCQLKENIIDHLMTFQNIVFMEQFKSKYNPDAGAAAAFKIESSLYHQSNYNFNIIITPVTPFQVEFLYNASVYEEVFLKRIQQHLKEIIRQVIADKDIKLEDIGITYDYLAAESSFLHQEEEEEWNI